MNVKFNIPEAFLLRFNDIDEEHQKLVDVLNRCVDALSRNSFSEFEKEIKKFYPLSVSHFTHEEELMSAVDYDGFEGHRDHHLAMLERLREIYKWNRDSNEAKWHILQFMFDNIIMDIAKADLKFDEFLIANGYKSAPGTV